MNCNETKFVVFAKCFRELSAKDLDGVFDSDRRVVALEYR